MSDKEHNWLQPRYADPRLQQINLLELLSAQSQLLREIRVLMSDDPEAALGKLKDLQFDLLRCACNQLRERLAEAAQIDGAHLIAGTVLDMSGNDQSAQRWSRWLRSAPVWSELIEASWYHAAVEAAQVVVETLSNAGEGYDRRALEEIERAVTELKPEDVLPGELWEEFFKAAEGCQNFCV